MDILGVVTLTVMCMAIVVAIIRFIQGKTVIESLLVILLSVIMVAACARVASITKGDPYTMYTLDPIYNSNYYQITETVKKKRPYCVTDRIMTVTVYTVPTNSIKNLVHNYKGKLVLCR